MTNVLMTFTLAVFTNVVVLHPQLSEMSSCGPECPVGCLVMHYRFVDDRTRKEIRTEVWEKTVFSWQWEGRDYCLTNRNLLSVESTFHLKTDLWVECGAWPKPWDFHGDEAWLGSTNLIGTLTNLYKTNWFGVGALTFTNGAWCVEDPSGGAVVAD